MTILKLFRPKVSIMVGLSTFAGACLFDQTVEAVHIFAVLGALALSAGCSALNQYQEAAEDAMMKRTKSRPLPSGDITPYEAVLFSLILLAVALCFFILTGSAYALLIFFCTIVIYNFVYTPMKQKTPFALLVGSVTGAIPPMLGYVSAGGSPFSLGILAVCTVLYIWQTPHFALLSEKHAEDYANAGFLTLSGTYGQKKANIFIKIWLSAFVCALFFIPVTDIYRLTASYFLHTVLTLILSLMLAVSYKNSVRTFHVLNAGMIIFFLLLVVDRIII